METTLVTFEQVRHVNRNRSTATVPKFTHFSFMLGGDYQPYVAVPGWPEIADGVTVVAVLRTARDWKSLVGWVNVKTGEVAVPNYQATLAGLLLFLALAVVPFFLLFGTKPWAYPQSFWPLAFLAPLGLASLFEYRKYRRQRNDARTVVELARLHKPARTPNEP